MYLVFVRGLWHNAPKTWDFQWEAPFVIPRELLLSPSEFKLIRWFRVGPPVAFPGSPSGREPACKCRRRKKIWVRSLGQEDPLEKEMATRSSILAWRIPWTEEPGGLQSIGLQRVRHDWATKHFTASRNKYLFLYTRFWSLSYSWNSTILDLTVMASVS